MTVIAYANGMLAVDSRTLQTVGEEDAFFTAHQGIKMKVMARGTFAVAVCGPLPTKSQWETIENVILKRLIICEMVNQSPMAWLTEEEAYMVDAHRRYFLVMSKNHIYYSSPGTKGEKQALVQAENDTTIAYGTGARYVYLAVAAGKNAKEAAEFTTTIDHLCGLPVLSVSRDELKGFSDVSPEMATLVDKVNKRIKRSKAATRLEEDQAA